MMKVKSKIWIRCKSKEEAKLINEAVRVDNERFIRSMAKENFIEAEAEAKDILSLLHTIDDFLACLSLAKESINIAKDLYS